MDEGWLSDRLELAEDLRIVIEPTIDGQSQELDVEPVEAWRRVNEENAVILDVREPEELAQIGVPSALHIPLGDLIARSGEVPSDRDVMVICHVGQRSALATEYLRQAGMPRVWNVRGGIIAWWKSRLPTR
jgi:rhodanese-related sulfurtransferase